MRQELNSKQIFVCLPSKVTALKSPEQERQGRTWRRTKDALAVKWSQLIKQVPSTRVAEYSQPHPYPYYISFDIFFLLLFPIFLVTKSDTTTRKWVNGRWDKTKRKKERERWKGDGVVYMNKLTTALMYIWCTFLFGALHSAMLPCILRWRWRWGWGWSWAWVLS